MSMDLIPLDSTFLPKSDHPLEGYDSLIWTERYREGGDFVITSPNIEYYLSTLPLMSFISIGQSDEIMYVEGYDITKDPDGVGSIKVTGRTLETFLENRLAVKDGSPLNTAKWTIGVLNANLCAQTMINAHIRTGILTANDILPNILLTATASVNINRPSMVSKTRQIERGNLYERVIEVLAEEDLGIFNQRPGISWTGSGALMNINAGADKSSSVILDVTAGHLTKTNYAISLKNYKSHAVSFGADSTVMGPINPVIFPNDSYGVTHFGSGWYRREMLVDSSDIPGTTSVDVEALNSRGNKAFKENGQPNVLDGEVSSTFNLTFGYLKDYYLGDIVKCYGEYGINQKAQVTEYIRIEDKEGYRDYPTLSVVG